MASDPHAPRAKARDPSTNLHGAIVQGLERLKLALDKDQRPLELGHARGLLGADRTARMTRAEDARRIALY